MGLVFDTTAVDNFNTPGTLPSPPWSSDGVNDIIKVIAGNIAECNSVAECANIYQGPEGTPKFFANNQWQQVTIHHLLTVNSSVLLVLRRQDSSNVYFFEIDGPLGAGASLSVVKIVGGVATAFFTGTGTVNPGDVVRFEAFGTTLTAKVNGQVIFSGNDSSFAGGELELILFPDTAITDAQVQAFSAGDIYQAGAETGVPSQNPQPIPDMQFIPTMADLFFADSDGALKNDRWASVIGFDDMKIFGGQATLATAGEDAAAFWIGAVQPEANQYCELQMGTFVQHVSGSIWLRCSDDLTTGYEFQMLCNDPDTTNGNFRLKLIAHFPGGVTKTLYDSITDIIISEDDFVKALAYGNTLAFFEKGALLFTVQDSIINSGGIAMSINGTGSELGDSGGYFNFTAGNLGQN